MIGSKAGHAHDRNITGKGVTIAVIDTGIDVGGSEFAGRVSPDSTAFEQRVARCATCAPETVRFGLDDVVGHGTEVASVAGAARDDAGVLGVAPDATILALKISGTDLSKVEEGSTAPIPESENANPALIAPAISYAVGKGAFVITMSLNGASGGRLAADQRAAMDQVRAADRLMVQSVSNATGEDSYADQIGQALVGTDLANKDWFLFAVGVDVNGAAREANGNAGLLADRLLAAPGNDIQVVTKDGGLSSVTGNSFAAPTVAGAAALLKQYWPSLGGRAISRILLDTATDAGAAGVDPVFGAGILNVEKAMQAQAPAASFAAAEAVIARWSSLTLSAPFGGAAGARALAGQIGSMTVLDRYGRDYRMRGEAGVRSRGSGLVASGMLHAADPWRTSSSPFEARFGLASSAPVGPWRGGPHAGPAILSFSPGSGKTATIAANVAVGAGGGLTGSSLRGIASAPAGISADWADRDWSAGFSSGKSRDGETELDALRMRLPIGLGLELTELRERRNVLGASLGGRHDSAGARTRAATLSASRLVAGVALSARVAVARTRTVGEPSMLDFEGGIVSTAFAAGASLPAGGGTLTLGISSPLRVERASASLDAPVAYDLISGALATERLTFDLSPDAREIDLELGWAIALSPTSSVRLGAARAFNAGHVGGAADTAAFLTIAARPGSRR